MKAIPLSAVKIESAQSCIGYKGKVIHIGDFVLTPAGASDPAGGIVVAILPTSWPTIPPTEQEYSCLVEINFGAQKMFVFDKAKEFE